MGHVRLRERDAIAKQGAEGGSLGNPRLSKQTRRGRKEWPSKACSQRECPVCALPFIGMGQWPTQCQHRARSTLAIAQTLGGLPVHDPCQWPKAGAKTTRQPMPPPHLGQPLWGATERRTRSEPGSARAPDAAAARRRCREPTEASRWIVQIRGLLPTRRTTRPPPLSIKNAARRRRQPQKTCVRV